MLQSTVAEPILTESQREQPVWLPRVLASLSCLGYAVVENVLDSNFLEDSRTAMYSVQDRILSEVGAERLKLAKEEGVLRLMMKFHPHFFNFLELPQLLAVIDSTVGNTAIMHLQNGFILPSFPSGMQLDDVFQLQLHMDFPRVVNQYLLSVNIFFAIDEFTEQNGGTLIVPGSHQKTNPPDKRLLSELAVPVQCPAGSMLVFDSTLWHAAGRNQSGKDRLAINHQFTRSYIKQQIDYVRALGEEAVLALPPRTQQLLGFYTRTVTSLDEYYLPEDERLYRKGQG